MLNPLDLNRLAVRIENLTQQSTRDWMRGDDLEFRQGLPDSRDARNPRRLPSVPTVRAAARGEGEITEQAYQDAIQVCLRLESLISRNRPNSTRRIMYDMVRGRFPLR
jgi:hypothetical protein